MIPEEESTLTIDEFTVCTVGSNEEGVYVKFGAVYDTGMVVFGGELEISALVDFLDRRVMEIM